MSVSKRRMKISTQKRIYENYKRGIFTNIGIYKYYIQYHPMAATHTWIIRSRTERCDWEFLMPLDEEIR